MCDFPEKKKSVAYVVFWFTIVIEIPSFRILTLLVQIGLHLDAVLASYD